MPFSTYLRFLIGDRHAIERLSDARGALDIGFLFVLSAGLAREYDHEDLLHEPWYALLPLVVSIGASFALYLLIALVAWLRKLPVTWRRRSYRRLLVCYWLMAPMAWLYAVPYERLLSDRAAIEANLWTLGLVSVWRVALVTRCVAVLYRFRLAEAIWPVMLFASGVALLVLRVAPIPIIDIMGGVRKTDGEQLLTSVAINVGILAVLSTFVWLIGTVVICFLRLKPLPEWQRREGGRARSRIPRALWWSGVAALVVGLLLLPWTQPPQYRRHQAERLLRSGQIDAALAYMSSLHEEDFPLNWLPPPHIAYGERNPELPTVMQAALKPEVAPWVRRVFAERYAFYYGRNWAGYPSGFNLVQMSTAELRRHVELLEAMPTGPKIAATYVDEIARVLGYDSKYYAGTEHDPSNPERRELLERLRGLAE